MSQITVRYLGQKVGQLAETATGIAFEYDPTFIATGHELSPFHLPLRPGVQARGGDRLPGLFDDSLPDAWGRRVMLEWFRRQGTTEPSVTPLAMLALVGAHGMGALTYEPARDAAEHPWTAVSLDTLQAAVIRAEQAGEIDLNVLAAVGSSAGGARPKALIALPRQGAGRKPFDARRHAQFVRETREQLDLVEIVYDDVCHAQGERGAQFGGCLVVAVQVNLVGR